MRKSVIIILVLALLALVVVPAFAATSTNGANSWFDQMFAAKQAWVDQAVKNGQLTPEQGQAWQNHLEQMQQFHNQYGYLCPGPGQGRMGGRMGGGPWWAASSTGN